MNDIISDLSFSLSIVKLMSISLAAIFAAVGSIKIFNKWNTGTYDSGSGGALYYDLLMWGGSCFFFLIGRVAIAVIF